MADKGLSRSYLNSRTALPVSETGLTADGVSIEQSGTYEIDQSLCSETRSQKVSTGTTAQLALASQQPDIQTTGDPAGRR